MDRESKKICKECGMPAYHHLYNWFDEITGCFLPQIRWPRKIEAFFDILAEKIFTFSGIASLRDNFAGSDIHLRSACFIDEFKKRGGSVKCLCGPFGFTNNFCAEIGDKKVRFVSLPIADFAGKYNLTLVEDKEKTKFHLKKGGFPIAEGKSFWFWQKKKALQFGIEKLGFPLVVKPRGGSVSRHVTTNIQNSAKLEGAIAKAVAYSPVFIVERFIPNASVYRATVIDFDFIACVKQAPANVVGDGILTIRELIDEKNSDPQRGEARQKEFTLYKIVENETTAKLLSEKGNNFLSIPKQDKVVFLQRDPFLKLGGDLIEMTAQVHPDNLKLFHQVAEFFDIRVVGMDFLAQDISRSYKEQPCAILELNNFPCIELHHFPFSGEPQNVAKAMVDLFFKYYL